MFICTQWTREGNRSLYGRDAILRAFLKKDRASGGWDARMQLGDLVFEPGTTQRIGFVFLWPESVQHAKNAGKFYLWDGRIIGEAIVVLTGAPDPDHETPIQMK